MARKSKNDLTIEQRISQNISVGNNVNSESLATKFNEIVVPVNNISIPTEHTELVKFIHSSYSLKPEGLIMSENKWKYLIRQALRGRNIMMVGPSGFGKTLAAVCVPKVLNRPYEVFNLGQTQDPQSYLIGNTHFRDNGTVFDESLFVKMIQIPYAVIILDEFSRGHREAWNILMPVLDVNQRVLKLDARPDTPTIKVAQGVTFISTANIGAEYTATNVIDRAMFERNVIIEMDILSQEEELKLLKYMYPNVNHDLLNAIALIAHTTRVEIRTQEPHIQSMISTRQSVEMAGMLYDGFTIAESAEEVIYPFYSTDGGNDSERTYIKSVVQRAIPISSQADKSDNSNNLFGDDEMNMAQKNS